MPLSEIRLPGRRPRAQELYEALRNAILRGELEPGERLVEETIAGLASVSRTPVREALRKLEVDGLVRESGRGMVVVDFSYDDLAELCAVRETLEGLACRLAAVSRSELELAALRRIMEDIRAATARADVSRLVVLNNAFHETVWQAARNRYLAHQLRTLRGLIERLQTTTLRVPERRREAMLEHEAILDAIERGDADSAERLARDHMRKAMALRLALRRMATAREAEG